ncbi:MAG: GvpL/GvpF family gas vesicle protein [Thermoguttaceae bacterium]|jgi:hypothetical protein
MASIASVPQTGLYLYGITLAGDAVSAHPPGVAGARVEEIVEGRLAALTSRLAVQKVRPQRSHLAAHHQVLSDLSKRQPVLPVVFGTIADGEEELHDFMQQNYDVLIKKLNRLRGMVEMTLKVYWETANIFEYFVATHRELEEMRNRLFQPGRTPTIEEKIQLGKLFESLSEQSRRRHTQRVIEALSPYCLEIRSIDPNEERMIMKLACLVETTHRQQWENGVEAAAHAFDNHYCFQYSGPWAPYNFAEIELNRET